MGCDVKDIVSALGLEMKDLFDAQEDQRREVARYNYCDEQGNVVFAKLRYEPKSFMVVHPNGGGWTPGIGDAPRVLYRLPDVKAAIANGQTIYVVEGEKDADKLWSMGVAATCNHDGAGLPGAKPKWRPEYSDWLTGADVIVVADRDTPGEAHARAVAASLEGKASRVKIMQAAVQFPGADISDHFAAGKTIPELLPFTIELAVPYSPVNWDTAWKTVNEDPEWLFEPVLESGTVNALFGKPGIGKSLLALSMAVEIAKRGHPVVYVDDENRIQDTVERLRAFGCTPSELDRLFMYSFAGLPPLDTPEGGRHLAAVADRHNGKLVVLDTTSRMVEGDENAASTYLQLYRCALVPLKSRGMCVLRLDHPGKDDSKGMRGSSAKIGDVDTIWRLTESEDHEKFFLLREKSRSGHGQDMVCLKRTDGPPLKYIFDPVEYLPVNDKIIAMAEWLDKHHCPKDYGRPKVRAFLNDTAGSPPMDTTELAVVVRYRKSRLAERILKPEYTDIEPPF
jgi:5S rRNA maturation endonuclease (ribonuclease M5)